MVSEIWNSNKKHQLNLVSFDTLDDLLMNAYFKYDIVECCAALIQHEKLDQLKSLLTTVCLNPNNIENY